MANDDDASDNVTYSLTSDAGGAFSIDTVSGSIFKSGFLDFETASQHEIKVLATSTDGSQSEASFVIDVLDVEDSNPGPNIDGNGQTGRSNDKVIYLPFDEADSSQLPDLSVFDFSTGELITLVENAPVIGQSNGVYSHFKIFDKIELGEGNIAVLYTANTRQYDAELDYSRGYESNIYAQILDKATGQSLSGEVQLSDMVGSEELRHLQATSDGGFSISYYAEDKKYQGLNQWGNPDWESERKTVFETYDSGLNKLSQDFGSWIISHNLDETTYLYLTSPLVADDVSDNNISTSGFVENYEVILI